ncbi:hypothetical protein CAPTEDRAFT_186970, partial [Capitella teleta]
MARIEARMKISEEAALTTKCKVEELDQEDPSFQVKMTNYRKYVFFILFLVASIHSVYSDEDSDENSDESEEDEDRRVLISPSHVVLVPSGSQVTLNCSYGSIWRLPIRGGHLRAFEMIRKPAGGIYESRLKDGKLQLTISQ